MLFKELKKGQSFMLYTEGLTYKKTSDKEADCYSKKGKKLCGSIHNPETKVIITG